MKWLLLGLLALGLALIGAGYFTMQSGSSGDERAGGALPILLGATLIGLDVIIAFVWLIARA